MTRLAELQQQRANLSADVRDTGRGLPTYGLTVGQSDVEVARKALADWDSAHGKELGTLLKGAQPC